MYLHPVTFTSTVPDYFLRTACYNLPDRRIWLGEEMQFSVDLINGVAIGVEFIAECEEHENTLIIDILIFRFLIQW